MESTRYNYIILFIFCLWEKYIILLFKEYGDHSIVGILYNHVVTFFLNINLVFPFSCKTIHYSTCSLTIHSSSCHPIVWGKMTLWNRCLKKMCTRQNWGNILLPPCNWTKKILTKNLHQYLCSLLTFSWHALL